MFFDAEGNSPGSISSRVATDPDQLEMVLGAQMAMAYVSGKSLLVMSVLFVRRYGYIQVPNSKFQYST